MIPQPFIDELVSRTDIAEVIGGYISLTRAGRNFKGLCPFHEEKTPSFIISAAKQIFHCFGCGAGGGAIQFVMLYEKVTFPEAVEILAKRAGMEIPQQKNEQLARIKTNLYEAVKEAAVFFHQNLLNTAAPRHYLNARGLDDAAIRQFQIGYAPSNNALMRHLRQKEYTLEIIEKACLITTGYNGPRDMFIDRVMFPICDARDRIVAFGGRIWKERPDSPKYINSPENSLYRKREHLFGLNTAKNEIAKAGRAIVVEGYLDMIIPFLAGTRNIVASLGTALTAEQIRLIRRYSDNIVLAYDADKAGQMATLRALDLLLENEINVKIARMPEGFDPDSLTRKYGGPAFAKLIEHCVDFFDYKLILLKAGLDIRTIEGKTKISQDLLGTINKLKSEIERYEYIKKLSSATGIREEVLLTELKRIDTGKQFKINSDRPRMHGLEAGELMPITEKIVLKYIFSHASALETARKILREEDFSTSNGRKAAAYAFAKFDFRQNITAFVRSIDDKNVAGLITYLLIDENICLTAAAFKDSLIKMRKRRALEIKNKIKEEMTKAEIKGDTQQLKNLINQYGKVQ